MIELIILIIGICIGSFLNVVGLRVPEKKSIIYPRSSCVECSYQLKWYDLMPILSYILVKGKCRKCNVGFSIKYPLFELLTGLIFLLLYTYSTSLELFLFQVTLMTVMVALSVSDLAFRLVPDKILAISFIFLVPFGIVLSEYNILHHLLAGIIVLFILLMVAILSKGGIGGGDIKLFALLALSLGMKEVFVVFIVSTFLGAFVGIILRIFMKDLKGLPFVPFMAIGVIASMLYSEDILHFLLNV